MKLAKDFRRAGVMLRKRISLFKYNLNLKRQIGVYSPEQDSNMLMEGTRSLNLFDFSSGRMADFYLLDDYSDASEFGGETECSFGLHQDEENPGIQTCKRMITHNL
jgi:hypothetical protein